MFFMLLPAHPCRIRVERECVPGGEHAHAECPAPRGEERQGTQEDARPGGDRQRGAVAGVVSGVGRPL
jgi:hypothetical protein